MDKAEFVFKGLGEDSNGYNNFLVMNNNKAFCMSLEEHQEMVLNAPENRSQRDLFIQSIRNFKCSEAGTTTNKKWWEFDVVNRFGICLYKFHLQPQVGGCYVISGHRKYMPRKQPNGAYRFQIYLDPINDFTGGNCRFSVEFIVKLCDQIQHCCLRAGSYNGINANMMAHDGKDHDPYYDPDLIEFVMGEDNLNHHRLFKAIEENIGQQWAISALDMVIPVIISCFGNINKQKKTILSEDGKKALQEYLEQSSYKRIR